MSQRHGLEIRGPAEGPYGPSNPPPPPPGRPPHGRHGKPTAPQDVRPPEYRTVREINVQQRRNSNLPRLERRVSLRASDAGDARSRSPAQAHGHCGNARYRLPSPVLCGQVSEQMVAPHRHGDNAQSAQASRSNHQNIDCFNCGNPGHVYRDCTAPGGGFVGKACFCCQEVGHLARDCTKVNGKENSRVARNQKYGGFNGSGQGVHFTRRVQRRRSRSPVYERQVQSVWAVGDESWPPVQAGDGNSSGEAIDHTGSLPDQVISDWAGACNDDPSGRSLAAERESGQGWGIHQVPRRQLAMPTSRMDHEMEDEVDWDDGALETDDAAAPPSSIPREAKQTAKSPPRPHEAKYLEEKNNKASHAQQQPHENNKASQDAPTKQQKQGREGGPRNQPTQLAARYVPPSAHGNTKARAKKTTHSADSGIDPAPRTAYDLRVYTHRIENMYRKRPKKERFINGANGKAAPSVYGSEQRHDLGLCFTTFLTRFRCEMGLKCPWRHHLLSNAERVWVVEYGKDRGKEFLDNADKWWAFPEVPFPGATMDGKGE